MHPTSPIILAGDFNYPAINWQTCTPQGCAKKSECREFLDVLSLFDLHQMVCKPTRGISILDLVLTTEPENMLVQVLECISDHNVVHCEYLLKKSEPEKATKTIFDYSRANVEAILEELPSFSVWFMQTMAYRNTNDNWLAIRRKLTELKQKYVPKIEIVSSTHSTWLTSQVKRAINKKNDLNLK